VNGQKVWTSYATIADKCFCYVRTDPSASKHRGISLLIIDMDTPGIDARPLRHINGKADVRRGVPSPTSSYRARTLSRAHGGWTITQDRWLTSARGSGRQRLRARADGARLVELAKRDRPRCRPHRPARIAASYELAASLRALGYKGSPRSLRDRRLLSTRS